uniref:Protein kinase domain-containing protein n=1 Tax=Vitrella brassicaformis TaxID=1169539 RepID=A0A7S1NW57_9ALVE|mmetsp:Transcript_100/g.274  ORF Transcript_100/g.274 Transcript_100/m.274 type:complete len:472 (+) Transcript_100:1-1416(+)
MVRFEDLDFDEKRDFLGTYPGTSGVVYKAMWHTAKGSRPVAIKVPSRDMFDECQGSYTRMKEAVAKENFFHLDHPNVVKIHGLSRPEVLDENTGDIKLTKWGCIVVMDLYTGGTLRTYLIIKRMRREKIPDHIRDKLIAQICEGLQYIHYNKIIHRNLKPENIMLSEKDENLFDVKIAGFDSAARSAMPIPEDAVGLGTLQYKAPEAFDQNRETLPLEVDIWSLGCIIAELHGMDTPFKELGKQESKIKNAVVNRRQIPDIPDFPDKEALKRCFAYEPSDRPSAMELLDALSIRRQGAGQPAVAEIEPAPLQQPAVKAPNDASREQIKSTDIVESKMKRMKMCDMEFNITLFIQLLTLAEDIWAILVVDEDYPWVLFLVFTGLAIVTALIEEILEDGQGKVRFVCTLPGIRSWLHDNVKKAAMTLMPSSVSSSASRPLARLDLGLIPFSLPSHSSHKPWRLACRYKTTLSV